MKETIIRVLKTYGLAFVGFACIMIYCVMGISNQMVRTNEQGMQVLKDAIHRATVQCYAIEGAYPSSVEYLEENYGIIIDRKKYNVFYSGFASNIIPDITIIPVE